MVKDIVGVLSYLLGSNCSVVFKVIAVPIDVPSRTGLCKSFLYSRHWRWSPLWNKRPRHIESVVWVVCVHPVRVASVLECFRTVQPFHMDNEVPGNIPQGTCTNRPLGELDERLNSSAGHFGNQYDRLVDTCSNRPGDASNQSPAFIPRACQVSAAALDCFPLFSIVMNVWKGVTTVQFSTLRRTTTSRMYV